MAIQTSPMASVTRSARRANTEGLQQLHPHPHPPTHPLHHPVQAFTANTVTRAAAAPQNISGYHHSLPGRTKRQLEPDLVDFDHPKSKRSRSSIEILIRPALPSVKQAVTNATANVAPTAQPTTPAATTPQATPLSKPTPAPKPAQQHVATVHPPSPHAAAATNNNNAAQLTKHQEKVINGIKHELDRLQPREADTHTKEGGRKLRSQEATRFKSELSAYFPEYDEVVGNEPKEQHLFNIDTPIVIFDSNPTRSQPVARHQLLAANANHGAPDDASASSPPGFRVPVRGYGDALFDDLVDAQRIDFDFLGISHKREPVEDPLPDATFVPSHKRAERLEKSIRNTERGRAQHEKDQIARLLGGLQGHDWLRVMGVSGITESRKKQFEPARQHFIKGCQAILEKFRQWSLEEKRRKAERDRALAEKAEAEATSEDESSSESGGVEDDDEGDNTGDVSDGDPPGSDDDGDSVAKQLREEASARSRASKNGKKRPRAAPQPRPPPKPEPPKEFKSFFKKRYERDAALHRHRRAGRKVVAWGHPIPEIPEVDFDLPEEFRDEETLKMQARKRRRDRRGKH